MTWRQAQVAGMFRDHDDHTVQPQRKGTAGLALIGEGAHGGGG